MAVRILIVEDDRPSMELMTYLLRAAGYEVEQARDGRAGLDAAERLRPALIVMDVQMPVLGGLDAARSIRADAELRSTPVVAVTAVAMVGDREKVLDAGFDGYLTKPIVPETFVQQLEAFLDPASRADRPAAVDSDDVAVPRRQLPTVARSVSVLVVDDHLENVALLRSLLEPFGYRVRAARRVTEALASARVACPDLIITDLHMPDASGFDLVRLLRSEPALAEIRIVLLSSSVLDRGEVAQAAELDVDDWIRRPIEAPELLDRLATVLAAAKTSRPADEPPTAPRRLGQRH